MSSENGPADVEDSGRQAASVTASNPSHFHTCLVLQIEGLTRSACADRVAGALRAVPGACGARVELTSELACIETDGSLAREEWIQTVRAAGYDAVCLGEFTGDDGSARMEASLERRREQRLREARQALVTAIGFGLPVVGLHWAGPFLSGSAPGAHFWPRFLQALLIVMLFVSPAGGPILAGGLRAIIFGSRNADLLVALGLVTTVAGSLTGMFVPSLRELNFFHQTAVILAVVNVGRYLEVRARGRAWPALAAHFFSVAPASRRCEPLEPTPRLSTPDRRDHAPSAREGQRLERFLDRMAGSLIPATVAIAGLTLAGWLAFGGTKAVYQAISATAAVLLTASPRALALAGPIAHATGRSAATLRRNAAGALLYHVTAIPLATFGILSAPWAAAAMALSTPVMWWNSRPQDKPAPINEPRARSERAEQTSPERKARGRGP